jgi:hypothetical protein
VDSSKHLERAVLHSLIVWPTAIEKAAKILTPADFDDPIHQQLFSAALSLVRAKKPIESVIWAQEAGGKLAYIGDLEGAPLSLNSLDEICKRVREAAQMRRLRRILSSQLERLGEESSSASAQEIAASLAEFKPVVGSQDFFVDAARFCSTLPEDIEWLVDGVIPVGSNGIIAGEPKAGKSFTIADLALSLASGTPFLGFRVPKPVRVGLIAREDYPGLTSWRINALRHGRSWPRMDDFCDNLYVNTRQQSDELRIDNPSHRQEVIEALTSRSIQFAIFDVLNVLHSADENDNTEMRKVMAYFSEIQAKAKCAIGLIHHLGKAEGKWTRRLRGASAIHGWVEWLLGISEDAGTRTMEIELKASQAPGPVRYEIHVNKQDRVASLKVVEGVPVQINTKGYMR